MKFISVIMLLILVSCTSGNPPSKKAINEFVRMNEIWQKRPSKEKVVKYFGLHFKEIEEGISYNYDNTGFTKMAFFFNKNEKLTDQFAIVGQKELSDFKDGVHCNWIEKKTQIREAHAVKTVESGECPEQHVNYFFRQDLGLYELRWY
ncbi:hypothetical protein ACJVC5_14985 [Peredibacter sp. HCB2-198]|uniref:hypothetical protein n=1 Tax=Peredibacter sp. HCB2-198 TaxID=3383025 RepID=UPI0038B648DD